MANKDEKIEYVIEPGDVSCPFSDEVLDAPAIDGSDEKTLRERIRDSYGLGWYVLATGAIAVTAAGIRHFKAKHPDEVDEGE